ncbi:MAG: phosphoesterase [candidate division Zixibacteria bacterium]|nr:phosphoesterase [candidate division Zixibacteria bacterium]
MKSAEKTRIKLKQIAEIFKDKKNFLIVIQNYPDPDALASAVALKELAKHYSEIQCSIASGGFVGRAENRALAKYLHLPIHQISELELSRFDIIALVDTQPSTGNNALPPEIKPDIVIDHHPIKKATRSVSFTDIRSRYGSNSSILFEYLKTASIEIDIRLATALLYGIRSDTQDLGRESSKEDIDAFLSLYPHANKRMLSEIQHSKTPRSYFRMLTTALRNAKVYKNCIISCMGKIDIPDIVGEIADLTLREEDTSWTLIYGYYQDSILLSLRTTDSTGDAGKIMSRIVKGIGTGGGHRAMAGGQILFGNFSADDRKKTEIKISKRFLKALKIHSDDYQRLIKTPINT